MIFWGVTQLLFVSSDARSVTALLRRLAFQELYPLEAVPLRNARSIRFPATVTASRDDERWAVRSYGTDFDLIDPSRGRLSNRWFSLGWGLGEDGAPVSELLLVQVDDTDGAELGTVTAELGSALGACGARWISDAGPDLPSAGTPARLRLAATLDLVTPKR